MNKKLKYLTALILAVLILVVCGVYASAEETDAAKLTDDATSVTKSTSDTDASEKITDKSADEASAPSHKDDEGARSEAPVRSEDTSTTVLGENDTDGNLFTRLYSEISSYASEILCALTFVGSMILAFAYKKGLLPLIERSLVSIGNAIGKIKDTTHDSAEKTARLSEDIEEKLTGATLLLDSLSKRIGALEDSLKESLENESEARLEKKQLRLVFDTQIDLLYDVFMSSALPQYQKDAVGEKVARMKEALRRDEADE